MAKYQTPNWSGLKTKADLKEKYFGTEYPGEPLENAQAVATWDGRVARYGDPTKTTKTEAKHEIVKVEVPGCGSQHNETHTIKVHKKLAPLFTAVFKRIHELNRGRYAITYLSTYYPRYNKNSSTIRNIRDCESSYGSCPSWVPTDKRNNSTDEWADDDGSGSWAHHALLWDAKSRKDVFARMKNQASNHSFGTAIDINPGTNPFDEGAKFDIPPWITQVFLDHGFYWGGFYGDYMHFEYMQPEVLEPPAPGAKVWLFPHKDKTADDLYGQNEGGEGGFFPVGKFRQWHGGIHLPGAGEVQCIADGKIVAARLFAEDPEGPDQGKTSRNFVLVKHWAAGVAPAQAVKGGEGAEAPPGPPGGTPISKPVWSLYYHLKNVVYSKDDASTKKLGWLLPMIEQCEGLEPGKRYYRVLTEEDEKDGTKGLNLREKPNGTVKKVVAKDALCELLDTKADKTWAHVKEPGGEEGYVYSKGSRVELVDGDQGAVLTALRRGDVVKLDHGVHAGDVLGQVGDLRGQPCWHWEIISEEFFDHIEALAQLKQWEDLDNDLLCDVATMAANLTGAEGKWAEDKKIDDDESKAAAPDLHEVATYHLTEWASGKWQHLQLPPWNLSDAQLAEAMVDIAKHQWWEPAAGAKCDLPQKTHLWHYHPVKFVAELQAANSSGEETSADETKPLRFKLRLEDGTALEGSRYELAIGGQNFSGTTGSGGLIEHDIPKSATEGELKFWYDEDGEGEEEEIVWPLKIS